MVHSAEGDTAEGPLPYRTSGEEGQAAGKGLPVPLTRFAIAERLDREAQKLDLDAGTGPDRRAHHPSRRNASKHYLARPFSYYAHPSSRRRLPKTASLRLKAEGGMGPSATGNRIRSTQSPTRVRNNRLPHSYGLIPQRLSLRSAIVAWLQILV